MVKRVSAKEAVAFQKIGYAFIDVRTPDEYRQGHPAGAINIPWQLGEQLKDNDAFVPIVGKLYPDKAQRLLLLDKIGKRSLAAAEVLERAGYVEVADMRPGYFGLVDDRGSYTEEGWRGLGLPSETHTDGGSYAEVRGRAGLAPEGGRSQPPPAGSRSAPPAGVAGVQRVSAKEAVPLQKIGYVFIDVRTPEEYAKGHPTGAINVPWMLSKGFDMVDNPAFLSVVEKLHPDKGQKLLLLDTIGKRSLAAARALHAVGYTQLAELRPGYLGIVDDRGNYTEEGWKGLGLPSENQTEGGSYREIKQRLGMG